MSSSKPPVSSTVLRQPFQNQGARRLPGLGGDVQPARLASEARQPDVKAMLRETFAQELAEMERERREEGALEASKQARAQLTEALARQEQQWLKTEASLRTALEAERLQIARLVEALEAQQEQLLSSMEPLVGRFALAVVERLLGTHAETRPLIADLAKQAIETYQLTAPLRIRVARADYETLLRLAPDDPLIRSFLVDPQASAGSCLIDFEGGQLDAAVQTQLANVASVLTAKGDGRVAGA